MSRSQPPKIHTPSEVSGLSREQLETYANDLTIAYESLQTDTDRITLRAIFVSIRSTIAAQLLPNASWKDVSEMNILTAFNAADATLRAEIINEWYPSARPASIREQAKTLHQFLAYWIDAGNKVAHPAADCEVEDALKMVARRFGSIRGAATLAQAIIPHMKSLRHRLIV